VILSLVLLLAQDDAPALIRKGVRLLPEASRAAERERLLKTLLQTRDADGTWNDRVFERSRTYGTAMALLALAGDSDPLPPALGR